MIIKASSDISACCVTDLKAESSVKTRGLFCLTCDGQIFAIQLDSYLYVMLLLLLPLCRPLCYSFRVSAVLLENDVVV